MATHARAATYTGPLVATVLKGERPDFALHTGDPVENVADQALWPIFFDIERELLRQTAFFPRWGSTSGTTSGVFRSRS
jgi:hypothetical protein